MSDEHAHWYAIFEAGHCRSNMEQFLSDHMACRHKILLHCQNGRLQKHVPCPGKGIKYSDHNIRILLSYTIANVFINKILSSQPVSVVRITNHQAASRKENWNNQ